LARARVGNSYFRAVFSRDVDAGAYHVNFREVGVRVLERAGAEGSNRDIAHGTSGIVEVSVPVPSSRRITGQPASLA
jgi:hypothetical protein